MTNERAILVLDVLNAFIHDHERSEALSMAINALKKQQTDDAERKEEITTEAALEAWQRIRNMYENCDASYVVLLNPRLIDAAIEALKKQAAEREEE